MTDYIEGRSLREVLRADGPMPWTRLRPLLAQLVEAAGVLHRRHGLLCGMSPDIMRLTPDDDAERLMISSAGIWQAQDLLATLHDQTLRGAGLEDSELHYVAPELLTGESADVASDIFTMAVLAYEMATGTLPYRAASMPALLGKMLSGAPARSARAPTKPAPGRRGRYREGPRTDSRATLPDGARLRARTSRLMQNAECRSVDSGCRQVFWLCIVHFALRTRHVVVGQHGEESHPRPDRVAILLGHDARRLRDVTEIVHDPRGEELAQRHATERRMNPRQGKIRRSELPGSNLLEIRIPQSRELVE